MKLCVHIDNTRDVQVSIDNISIFVYKRYLVNYILLSNDILLLDA